MIYYINEWVLKLSLFFFDENCPAVFSKLVNLANGRKRADTFQKYKKKLPYPCSDVELIDFLGTWDTKPIFVTFDKHIREIKAELDALKRNQLSYVLIKNLTKEKLKKPKINPLSEQSWRLLKIWEKIEYEIELTDVPIFFIANLDSLRISKIEVISNLKIKL